MQILPPERVQISGWPHDFEVRIAVPPSYASANESYPVLWVTDGSRNFEMAVSVVSQISRIPRMIVVGIGTPRDDLTTGTSREQFNRYQTNRLYDFTTQTRARDLCVFDGLADELAERACQPLVPTGAEIRTGGASGLLRFLTNDLRRAVESRFRTTREHTLFGYSGGGTFCVYALLTNPEGFAQYICSSPSLAGENGALFQMEERYAASHNDMRAKLFLSAGEDELISAPIISGLGVESSMSRMAEVLSVRNYPSLDLHAHVIPGEIHDGSGIASALSLGLRLLSSAPSSPPAP
jgi:predicted alpha/beta superfamily hydrolase